MVLRASSASWCTVLLSVFLLTACFAPRPSVDEDGGQDGGPDDGGSNDGGSDDGGSDDGGSDGDGGIDPPDAPECRPGDPHLVLGLRSLDYQAGSRIARLDRWLRPCEGYQLDSSLGDIIVVGGTSSGIDLIGLDDGKVLVFEGDYVLWDVEAEGYGYKALALFTIDYEGREVVGILWGDSNGSGGSIELFDLENGDSIKIYDVSSSVTFASQTVDGESNTIAGLIEWDGVQDYRASATADDLGVTGELQIAAPRSGELHWLTAGHGEMLIASEDGVLFWQPNVSQAFMGPIACLWPAIRGGELPVEEAEYLSVVHDEENSALFLAVVDGDLDGVESTESHVFRMSRQGECEYLYSAPEDMMITNMAWSGF